jgi:hypothetical protein
MTELAEKIQVHLDNPDSDDCPFCPGKETEHKWITIKGEKNDSGILRKAMVDPTRCSHAQQSGAKPKDGVYPNQGKDKPQNNPHPIFHHAKYGNYSNQAHHCISGNEIMKGTPLEKILANEKGDYLGQTGYTINTAANGVYLPSYPEKYSGSMDDKYDIMKLAMAAGKGQAHIGGHTGHEHAVGSDYPTEIKKELDALEKRILNKSEECPYCVEGDGAPKKPFIPPYKVNQWLDTLSKDISRDLKGPVKTWPYFISRNAKRYHLECSSMESDPMDDL